MQISFIKVYCPSALNLKTQKNTCKFDIVSSYISYVHEYSVYKSLLSIRFNFKNTLVISILFQQPFHLYARIFWPLKAFCLSALILKRPKLGL